MPAPKEQWRWVPGSRSYDVSNLGRVGSWLCPGRKGAPRQTRRLLNPSVGKNGYPYVVLTHNGRRKNFYVHTLVLLAFKGERPEGGEARHLDGDRCNANLTNLVWGTSRQNAYDRKRHGTQVEGEEVINAVLTEVAVVDIRKRVSLGESYASIARRYNVCPATVGYAAVRHTWKHVP